MMIATKSNYLFVECIKTSIISHYFHLIGSSKWEYGVWGGKIWCGKLLNMRKRFFYSIHRFVVLDRVLKTVRDRDAQKKTTEQRGAYWGSHWRSKNWIGSRWWNSASMKLKMINEFFLDMTSSCWVIKVVF